MYVYIYIYIYTYAVRGWAEYKERRMELFGTLCAGQRGSALFSFLSMLCSIPGASCYMCLQVHVGYYH